MNRILSASAAVFFLFTGTAACGDDDTGNDGAASVTTAGVTDTANGGGEAKVTNLKLVSAQIKFDKASLTAKADEPFTITLVNDDTSNHNITIEDLDIDEDANAGKTVTTKPVTPVAGTYKFICGYHPTTMQGELVVS